MTGWSRRSFIASTGMLAAAGGTGAAAAVETGEGAEVPLLRTYVAGAERRVVREAAGDLRSGAPLRLMREPENDYDSRAVSVWTQTGTKLGYVPRIDNQPLANLLDAGLALHASVGSVGLDRSRPEVGVEVSLPVGRAV